MKAARKVAGSLSNGEAPSIDIVEVEAVGRPAYGSQEWAETYSDDLGESPDY